MKTTSVLAAAAAAALSTGVEGRNLVPNQPRATASVVLPDDGVSPKPTPPPGWNDFHFGLVKRATTSQKPLTMLVAPDNTCGWISATVAIPYTCGRGATCGLVLAQSSFSGLVMCYNTAGYNFRFGCIDYSSYYSSSACDHLCAENTQILKCTSSGMPYCNTIAFPGSITDYWCNSVSYSTAQLAQTTWRGQTSRRVYSSLVQTSSTSFDLSSVPTTVSIGAPTATSAETSPTTSQTSDNGGESKTPVGAIVGGVVGGVAAIGLGLLALFFFLRRKKNRTEEGKMQTPQSNQSPMPPNASPGMPMTQAYYDPKFGGSPPLQQQQGYPPQGYPPQQQQYQQNTPPPHGGYYPQQSLDPHSPTTSQMTDPRLSHMTTSPTPTWTNAYGTPPPPGHQQPVAAAGLSPPMPGQPQGQFPGQTQPQHPPGGVVHEAPTQTGDNHRGQMHELS
ncbi:hypothetical protein QQS21_011856 [Conoideocrella luteorostrata]|uniref:Uncharacterized protein n=1 Tax=Conoideocrella luteorostrata TaxID=1105319 RepID=A0AAJ0CCL3_9HYPO|nr:hypothetical protein QQS21_011856 [Conoideocrella luteorostrata]